MEEITIYKFQLEEISETLRIVSNTLKSHERKTCLDRMVVDSKLFADNALEGRKDIKVRHGKNLD